MNKLFTWFRGWFQNPSRISSITSQHHLAYLEWEAAFQRLEQTERYSDEYWRIWNNEVVPAYHKMTTRYEELGDVVGNNSAYSPSLLEESKGLDTRAHNRQMGLG